MTMRMSALVLGKRTQTGVALTGTPAEAGREGGNQSRLQIAGDRNPRDGREHESRERFHAATGE